MYFLFPSFSSGQYWAIGNPLLWDLNSAMKHWAFFHASQSAMNMPQFKEAFRLWLPLSHFHTLKSNLRLRVYPTRALRAPSVPQVREGEEIIQTFLFCSGHAPPLAKVVYFWGGCIFSVWRLRCNSVRSHFPNTLCLQRHKDGWLCSSMTDVCEVSAMAEHVKSHINIPLLVGRK